VCFDNRQGGGRGSVGLALTPSAKGKAKAAPDAMGEAARPERRRGRGRMGSRPTPRRHLCGPTKQVRGYAPYGARTLAKRRTGAL
jgi:hypothetical protein